MVDNLTFDDGEPITNTKLQSLYSAIKKLEGDLIKTTIENKTTNTKFIPTIYSGVTPAITLGKAYVKTDVSFDGFTFSSSDVFVIVTPGSSTATLNVGTIDYYVGSRTSAGFSLYTSSAANDKKSIYFHYIAVEMKPSS